MRSEIITALNNEGQVEIISGQRTAIGMPKNVFTSNASLSLGYNLEAGTGTDAEKICIRAKYTNIRLNHNSQLSRPEWANLGGSTPHDRYLKEIEAKANDKVLMGATALVTRDDGNVIPGPFLMVLRGDTARGTDFKNTGVATVTSSSGGISQFLIMANIEMSANFFKLSSTRD